VPLHILNRLRRAAVICFGLAIVAGSLTSVPGAGVLGDKAQHFLSYAGWATLVAASPRPLARIGLYAIVIGLVGAGIEAVQPMVGREASLFDLLANLAGTAAGMAGGLILRSRLYTPEVLNRRAA